MAPSAALAALSACSLLLGAADSSGMEEEMTGTTAPNCSAAGGCDDGDDAGLLQMRRSESRFGSGLSELTRGDYTVLPGTWFTSYGAAGSWTTVRSAVTKCQQEADCVGFFTHGSPPTDEEALIFAWFATAGTTGHGFGYTAFLVSRSPSPGGAYGKLQDAFFVAYDPARGSWQTQASAEALCDLDSSCRGFFLMGSFPSDGGRSYVWFGTSDSTATAVGYTAFAKGSLTPFGTDPTKGPDTTPGPDAGTSTVPPQDTEGTVSSQAWELFDLARRARLRGFTCPGGQVFPANPAPLRFDCRLWEAARGHAEDMATHDYFGRGFEAWRGELLTAGQPTASEAFQAILHHDASCRIFGDSFYTRIGAGHGYSANSLYKHYWVQKLSPDTGETYSDCIPS